MSTPADHPHRDSKDLGDLLEDFGFGMMLFAGAAILAVILVLMAIL
jgi:hypothetical protein